MNSLILFIVFGTKLSICDIINLEVRYRHCQIQMTLYLVCFFIYECLVGQASLLPLIKELFPCNTKSLVITIVLRSSKDHIIQSEDETLSQQYSLIIQDITHCSSMILIKSQLEWILRGSNLSLQAF